MDLRYLVTFDHIVKQGSFTKAAKELNYTQSTITLHVNQLEKELNTQLFEKVGRRMVLTKAGEQLIPYVDEVLQSLWKMNNFQNAIGELQGDLSIAAPESLLCFRLPEILKAFHNQAPKVKLYLHSLDSQAVCNALRNDTVDLGLMYDADRRKEDDIQVYSFGVYPMVMAVSPQVKKKYPNLLEQKQDFPLLSKISPPIKGGMSKYFEQVLHERGLTFGNTIEIRSTQTILNLAKNDMGVCYLPRFVLLEDLECGTLEELPIFENAQYISAGCGIHKNKWISPAMELFIKLIQVHN